MTMQTASAGYEAPSFIKIAPSIHKPGQGSSGTAFLINDDNVWLTARHVVEGCKQVYLTSKYASSLTNRRTKNVVKSPYIPAKVIAIDSKSDSAALKLSRDFSNKRIQPLAMAHSQYRMRNGDKGFALGFPSGQHGEIAMTYNARLRAEQPFPGGTIRYDMDNWNIKNRNTVTNQNGGLSGGPIINHQGAVVGINAAGRDQSGRNLGSSSTVTIDSIYNFMKRNRISTGMRRHPNQILNELSYKKASRQMRKDQQVVMVYCQR